MKKLTVFYDRDRYILEIIQKLLYLLEGEASVSYKHKDNISVFSNTQ